MNDGGPAFPVECSHDDTGKIVGIHTGHRSGFAIGLTVRDYMAAQALVGFQVFVKGAWCGVMPSDMAEHIAENCYQIADAMLAARDAREVE